MNLLGFGYVSTELMVLGFISLLLTFGQNYIAKICIPLKIAKTMLPCPRMEDRLKKTDSHDHLDHQRRLLWNEHRFLSGGDEEVECKLVSASCYLCLLSHLHTNQQVYKWNYAYSIWSARKTTIHSCWDKTIVSLVWCFRLHVNDRV